MLGHDIIIQDQLKEDEELVFIAGLPSDELIYLCIYQAPLKTVLLDTNKEKQSKIISIQEGELDLVAECWELTTAILNWKEIKDRLKDTVYKCIDEEIKDLVRELDKPDPNFITIEDIVYRRYTRYL